jgi:hypothetical protein
MATDGPVLKTSWKRRENRVDFFAKEASNSDMFELVGFPSFSFFHFIHIRYLDESFSKFTQRQNSNRWLFNEIWWKRH